MKNIFTTHFLNVKGSEKASCSWLLVTEPAAIIRFIYFLMQNELDGDEMVKLNIPPCFCHAGSEHESVHWGSGSANTERSEVCGNNGNSAQEPWKQVQRGGKWPREQRCQAVQGNKHFLLSHLQSTHWLSGLLPQSSGASLAAAHRPFIRRINFIVHK